MYACLHFVINTLPCPSSACAPTFQHNPVKRVLVAKNGRVVIQCRPKAAPKPTFSWSKDTELLSNSTRCRVVSITKHFAVVTLSLLPVLTEQVRDSADEKEDQGCKISFFLSLFVTLRQKMRKGTY